MDENDKTAKKGIFIFIGITIIILIIGAILIKISNSNYNGNGEEVEDDLIILERDNLNENISESLREYILNLDDIAYNELQKDIKNSIKVDLEYQKKTKLDTADIRFNDLIKMDTKTFIEDRDSYLKGVLERGGLSQFQREVPMFATKYYYDTVLTSLMIDEAIPSYSIQDYSNLTRLITGSSVILDTPSFTMPIINKYYGTYLVAEGLVPDNMYRISNDRLEETKQELKPRTMTYVTVNLNENDDIDTVSEIVFNSRQVLKNNGVNGLKHHLDGYFGVGNTQITQDLSLQSKELRDIYSDDDYKREHILGTGELEKYKGNNKVFIPKDRDLKQVVILADSVNLTDEEIGKLLVTKDLFDYFQFNWYTKEQVELMLHIFKTYKTELEPSDDFIHILEVEYDNMK